MNNFNDAFEDLIKDMYNAEKQLLKALPKLAKNTTNEQLRMGFQEHLEPHQPEQCGFKPTGKVCPAMQGLVEEAQEHIKEAKPSPLLDAALIAAAQKVEHYEMANYGTARAWAEVMGQTQAAQVLQQILEQESATNEKLTQLAEGTVNQEACNFEMPQQPKRRSTTSRSSSSKSGSSARKSTGSTRKKATAAR